MRDTLLLVDDDPGFREVYRELLADEGYRVVEAADEPSAEAAFRESGARLVVLDLMLPPADSPEAGAALCRRMLEARPDAKVIVVSGTGDTRAALSTVQVGAYDFIEKPVDPDVLAAVLARASSRLRLEARVSELETSLAAAPGAEGMLGAAPTFVAARELADRVAPTDVPVLITGATGTGKEVFARYLVARSRRASGPFVTVNCAALPATLLESTLFGHVRGAFTGAIKDAPGLFVEADGGTLFLDELGDMEPALQVKLLRVLESGELLPVGASQPRMVDVRLLSATHRPLEQMIQEGQFREDLYWRIRGIEIALPTLSERPSDLSVLAQHFLNQARALVPSSTQPTLSEDALHVMRRYHWPGNLRELRHEMQRALVMAAGRPSIEPAHLSPHLSSATSASEPATTDEDLPLEAQVIAVERRALERALERAEGNKSQAAQRLGLSRQGLLNKLDRHGLR